MDGSAASRTAFFFEPFSDSAGYRGLMRQPESDMRAWVGAADSAPANRRARDRDRANAIILSIYDSVARAHGALTGVSASSMRSNLRSEDIARFGALRVVPSMQPIMRSTMAGGWNSASARAHQTTYAFGHCSTLTPRWLSARIDRCALDPMLGCTPP